MDTVEVSLCGVTLLRSSKSAPFPSPFFLAGRDRAFPPRVEIGAFCEAVTRPEPRYNIEGCARRIEKPRSDQLGPDRKSPAAPRHFRARMIPFGRVFWRSGFGVLLAVRGCGGKPKRDATAASNLRPVEAFSLIRAPGFLQRARVGTLITAG